MRTDDDLRPDLAKNTCQALAPRAHCVTVGEAVKSGKRPFKAWSNIDCQRRRRNLMADARQDLFRAIPSIETMLEEDEFRQAVREGPRRVVVDGLREAVEAARAALAAKRSTASVPPRWASGSAPTPVTESARPCGPIIAG